MNNSCIKMIMQIIHINIGNVYICLMKSDSKNIIYSMTPFYF